MVGKTKHNLGMLITDKPSGTKYGPLLFPVSSLKSSSDEATFGLVGNYVAAAVNNVESPGNPVPTTNLDTPVLPASICSDGMMNESVDMSQYKDIVAVGGRFIGSIIEGLTGDQFMPSTKLNGTGKPTRAIECFGLAKEAGSSSYKTVISTQPVLEGAGCLFLQSKNGHVVYDQKTIEKYNIKREFLETYVTNHQCRSTK